MNYDSWLLFTSIALVATITPGPAYCLFQPTVLPLAQHITKPGKHKWLLGMKNFRYYGPCIQAQSLSTASLTLTQQLSTNSLGSGS